MSVKSEFQVAVYKNRIFARFARKARIGDGILWRTAQRANEGLADADLGGGIIKQRIARAGEGKSGGSRSILLLRKGTRAVYVYGFEKKDQANVMPADLDYLRSLAQVILGYTDEELSEQVRIGSLIPVKEIENEKIPE